MMTLLLMMAVAGLLYGLVTRAGRLHRQMTSAVICLYLLVGIIVYISVWSLAERAAGLQPYAREWADDPLLGTASALEFAACVFAGKWVASLFVHRLLNWITGRYGRAQVDVRRAQSAGARAPRRGRGVADPRRAPRGASHHPRCAGPIGDAYPDSPAGEARPERTQAPSPMNTTVQTIGIIFTALTALVGLITAIRLSWRNGKKIDVVHVLVNGQMSKIQSDLREALSEIDTLRADIRREHQGVGGPRDAPTAAQEAALAGAPVMDAAIAVARSMNYPGRQDGAPRPDGTTAGAPPTGTDEQGYPGEMIDGNIYTRPDAKG